MIATADALIISELFYTLDTSVRNDLYRNQIADERDYVSRMVTHFNYPFGIINKYLFNNIRFKSKWFAKVNSGHYEQKFGCDSMIVFRVGNKLKVGLFEAKWPRVLKDPSYNWDYTQKKTKTSHFTSQIKRQAQWAHQVAIWEMFFYEERVGTYNSPFDKEASTCIRHQYAKKLVDSTPGLRTIWDNNDLNTLIKTEQSANNVAAYETNLKQVVFDILTCNFGKVIKVGPTDKIFTLKAYRNKEIARCPVITQFDLNEDNQFIEGLMAQNGLSFFMQLNIESLNG